MNVKDNNIKMSAMRNELTGFRNLDAYWFLKSSQSIRMADQLELQWQYDKHQA